MGEFAQAASADIRAARELLARGAARIRSAAEAGEECPVAVLRDLEEISTYGAMATTAAVHLGVVGEMGRLVGSSKPVDYLTDELGLSGSEANRRIKQAEFDYGALPEDQALVRAARLGREQEIKPPRESLEIIRTEVDKLHARDRAQEVYAEAIEQAAVRRGKDLRAWVRDRVREIDGVTTDETTARARRSLKEERLDDNLTRFELVTTNDQAAVINAATAGARLKASKDDARTFEQRRHDLFMEYLATRGGDQPGKQAMVVVSMSVKDIVDREKLPEGVRFPTTSGVDLSPKEILRLGVADIGFGVVHDPTTGAAIFGGRIRRFASREQKWMLFAEKNVCSHPDCERPAGECDDHHLEAFAAGGRTDPDNLDLVCRPHHVENDDTRTHRNGKSFYDTDPVTGRKGLRKPDGSIELNDTLAQERSGGHKIRNQPWPEWWHGDGEPPPF